MCRRLWSRETRDAVVGKALSSEGWGIYVVTVDALTKILPDICHQRCEDGFDFVLEASCEVGLPQDWGDGHGLFLLCLHTAQIEKKKKAEKKQAW